MEPSWEEERRWRGGAAEPARGEKERE
jgi:hypothetical protein